MPKMTFSYADDLQDIEKYNARRGPNSPTRLQTHMGPAPYDGDPHNSSIVLLMNNPGYDVETSEPADHELYFLDWPLAGLHPDAPPHFRNWYLNNPLGYLVRTYGAQRVSQRVCLLQMNPWASEAFDAGCVLPSRPEQFELARAAARRGAVVIVGRSFRIWGAALGELPHHFANSVYPKLSPGGLPAVAWEAVARAME